jgi:hypothetical protein
MNPLTLRQSFQTANMEAMRAAQGVHEGLAREAAQKKVLDDRMTQESNDVAEIPKADALRTEERKGRERQGKPKDEEGEEEDGEATGTDGMPQAKTAATHLDFLI